MLLGKKLHSKNKQQQRLVDLANAEKEFISEKN